MVDDKTIDFGTGVFPLWKQHNAFQKPSHSRYFTSYLLSSFERVLPAGAVVIDIGAGPGHYVKRLADKGFKTQGIDGTPGIAEITGGLVLECDLTGDCSRFKGCAEWGLFIDVGEHIPQQFEQTVIDNVSMMPTQGLIVSWGFPFTKGYRHCNGKSVEYVVREFVRRGWFWNGDLTELARMDTDRYYRRSLNVLKKAYG